MGPVTREEVEATGFVLGGPDDRARLLLVFDELDRLRGALEAIRAFGPTEPVGTGPTPWDIAAAALRR